MGAFSIFRLAKRRKIHYNNCRLLFSKAGFYHAARILPLPPRVSARQCGLRHRHRQCLALSLCHRQIRRRTLCPPVSGLPAGHGRAGFDDGAGRRPRRTQKRRAGLPRAGKARTEVAHPRLVLPDRLLPADDGLLHRHRQDGHLFREIPDRRVPQRHGRRDHRQCFRRNAGRPRPDGPLDGACRHCGLPCLQLRPAKRP